MTRRCDLLAGRTSTGYVVRVQGRGTSAHSQALKEFVLDCFQRDSSETVAIDLLGCDYLDSTFLGCLLRLQKAGTPSRLEVVADETVRKRLLAATQLDSFLNLVTQAPACNGKFLRVDVKTAGRSSPRPWNGKSPADCRSKRRRDASCQRRRNRCG